MDWTDLTQRMVAASRASFSDLMAIRRGERFYAFILYTDGDCYTVLPSANSIEKHHEKISKEGIEDAKNAAGYKWYFGEWAYEAWQDGEFTEICRDLSVASQLACEKGEFPAFRRQVHASMIKALAVLGGEGFFDPPRSASKELVVYVSSTDHEESIELENMSARILNSPEVHAEFIKRYPVG